MDEAGTEAEEFKQQYLQFQLKRKGVDQEQGG